MRDLLRTGVFDCEYDFLLNIPSFMLRVGQPGAVHIVWWHPHHHHLNITVPAKGDDIVVVQKIAT